VLTKLTEAEHRMLKVRASEAGVSVQDLMRSIIKTYLKV
jgi:plasmid stability protein